MGEQALVGVTPVWRSWPPASALADLAVTAVVGTAAAVRSFRWQ